MSIDKHIRTYPYPYKAALAINNDIDFMPFSAFVKLHEYFSKNPNKGGLGLDLSDSMFFFNTVPSSSNFTYFEGTQLTPSRYAPALRSLIKSGHIDTMHAYGFFDAGCFCRTHAEAIRDELAAHGLSLPIWSNHGGYGNIQNIGGKDFSYHHRGDDFCSEYYHLDILHDIGTKYFAICSSNTFQFSSKAQCDKLVSAKEWKKVTRRIRFNLPIKRVRPARMPLNPNWAPELPVLYTIKAQDNSSLQGFRRYRGFEGCSAPDIGRLGEQITRTHLSELVDTGSCVIIYQHLSIVDRTHGMQIFSELNDVNKRSIAALEDLSDRFHRGEIYVASSAHLLDYLYMINAIIVSVKQLHRHADITVSVRANDLFPLNYSGLTIRVSQETTSATFYFPRGVTTNGIIHNDKGEAFASVPVRRLMEIDWDEVSRHV